MLEIIQNFINSLFQYSYSHSINPYIFCILYLISIPVFYYPLIYIKKIINSKDEATYHRFLLKGVMISSTAYVTPLVYVILFGKNLSFWLVAIILAIIFANVIIIIKKFKTKEKF